MRSGASISHQRGAIFGSVDMLHLEDTDSALGPTRQSSIVPSLQQCEPAGWQKRQSERLPMDLVVNIAVFC